VAAIRDLERAGANEIVPEEFTTSLELFARVLRHVGMPVPAIRRLVETARRDHYRIFAEAAPRLSPLHQLGALGVELDVDTLDVAESSAVAGENPVTLKLRTRTGAMVLAVIRGSDVLHDVDHAFRFAPRDLVVMVGTEEALGRARALFAEARP
jgi:CPA2 family monovalent cation:H+ antiporter-2